MALEKELRVVYLDLQAAEGDWAHTGQSLSIGHLKASPPTVTIPLTRPHLLQ